MKSILWRKNKKAWLRIVEAFIAIMIILGAVLVVLSKQTKKADISELVYERQNNILEIIANNESLREGVLSGETEKINNFIGLGLPSNWGYATSLCNIKEICGSSATPNDRDVYVSETIISANLTDYPDGRTQKLRFFVWRK